MLVEGLGAAHVVVGYDFVFGKNRRGNAEVLARAGERAASASPRSRPQAEREGAVYSSTLIRDRLLAGDPRRRRRCCSDRPWEIEGRVEHGDRRGRTLGFPTANMHARRVSAAERWASMRSGPAIDSGHDLQWIDGVANLGRRPTVGGTGVQLEVHLFDFAGDLYGKHLRVALLGFIRPEKKFSGLDAVEGADRRRQRHARGACSPTIAARRSAPIPRRRGRRWWKNR